MPVETLETEGTQETAQPSRSLEHPDRPGAEQPFLSGCKREVLQSMIEAIPVGVVEVGRDGAISFANLMAQQVLGLSYDQLTRSYVVDFSSKTLKEDGSECPVEDYPVTRCLESGVPCQDITIGVRRPDGAVSWAVYSAFPYFEPGVDGPSGAIVTFLDISQGKRIEQERDRLFVEAQTARDRLRKLSRRLVEIQETERRHLARELHDEIGQQLTALRLNLERGRAWPSEEAGLFLEEAHGQVQQLLSLVREMSLDLRPAMLDDLGLVPALLWHFDRLSSSRQLEVDFKHSGLEGRRFRNELETAVYRVIQEALTNVARHARTAQATVRVWATDDRLSVQVRDQGVGFESQSVLAREVSSGLSGMRERVALLHGRLELASSPGTGTRLTAEWPLITMPLDEAHQNHVMS